MRDKVIMIANRLRMTVPTFFMTVYEAKYHRVQDVSNDVVLFDNLNIVPDYIQEFIEEVEKCVPSS